MKKNVSLKTVIVSMVVSAFLFAVLVYTWDGVSPGLLWSRLAWPLLRLVSIMAVSLILSAVVEGMGWNSIVAGLARPLMRAGNFSDYSGTAFTSAFLSGIAANTMLWNAYRDHRISRREMFLATLLNVGLPSYVLHLPVTFAVIVPLVGSAGAIYLGITFFAAVLRTVVVIVLGRLLLGKHHATKQDEPRRAEGTREEKLQKVRRLAEKYIKKRLLNILCYTVPIYILVVLLQQSGFFHWLQQQTAHLVTSRSMPVEGISVVVFSIVAEFTAGAAAAGAMLSAGVLTIKQTVTALLLGNIIATPVRALRHQLPRYLGIYQPRIGIQLLLAGQALRVVTVVISGLLYYFLF